ncbi:MAG: hypothetical protein H6Q33_4132, partial [Deltaproteobacteria bacterium]|nr:hypothetical protein [Deltaproteobacteria bacterium]
SSSITLHPTEPSSKNEWLEKADAGHYSCTERIDLTLSESGTEAESQDSEMFEHSQ